MSENISSILPDDEIIPAPSTAFETTMAILIAVVTIAGAVVAWRASAIDALAGDADFAGLTATINAAQTKITNTNTVYEHYRGYTVYTRNSQLQNQLEETVDFDEASDLDLRDWAVLAQSASDSQQLFSRRFLNEDGSYNLKREFGESWAEAGQSLNLDPAPHFDQADGYHAKSNALIMVFIVQAVALLFFTVAEGLNPAHAIWRYSLALLGLTALVFSVAAAIIVELG
ncbi:MAG: hypothetical protein KDI79_27905 [Anaerolineae bacterium]|nr:hypothetical protein [Anaerolineae bacterium]